MVKYVPIPSELKNIYDNWAGIAKDFNNNAAKHENYFLGDVDDTNTPFDKRQLDRIRKTTGVEATINRIYSVTSQAIAYLTRKRQGNKTVAINEKFKNHAITLDKIKQGIINDSLSVIAEEECIKDMLIGGIGIKGVRRPINQYETIFPAVIEHIHYSEIVLDPNCTDRTLRKMQGYFVDKEITLEEAKRVYQGHIDMINIMYINDGDQPLDWTMFTKANVTSANYNRRSPENLMYSQTVWAREYYDKVFTKCYLIEDPKLGIRKLFAENLTELQTPLLRGAIRVEEDIYVRKTTMLGDYIIDVTIEPITEWGMAVRFFEWGGKPYKSKSFIHYGIPIQQAYDSAMQLLLLNGYVITNAGYKAPRQAIPESERKNWEEDLLNPLKLKLYDPVEVGDKVLIPEKDLPGQLSNFYPELLRMFSNGLYEITGFDPALMGITTESSVETFSTLNKYETAALQRIMLQFDHISLAQVQEGNVLLQYILSEMRPEVAYTFLDSDGRLNEVEHTIASIKEAKLAKYRVYTIPYESMPTQRLQVSQELLKIAQTTADPSERKIFIHHALALQDIREVDGLLEEIDEVNNLKGMINQINQVLDREKEIGKQNENRAIRAEYREKIYSRLITGIEKIAREEANEILGSKIRQLQQELKEEKSKDS